MMVRARTEFLESGHYDFLLDALKERIQALHPESILDMGCGQGYYTKRLCETAVRSYGVDASKHAVAKAAAADKKTMYAVGNLFHVPLEAQSMDCITSIFVPLAENEVRRLCRPNGTWIIVEPGIDHCWNLKEFLYDTPIKNRLKEHDFPGFQKTEDVIIKGEGVVAHPMSLLAMTPYYYHCSSEKKEQLETLSDWKEVFEFRISVWRKYENQD